MPALSLTKEIHVGFFLLLEMMDYVMQQKPMIRIGFESWCYHPITLVKSLNLSGAQCSQL